MSNSGKQRVWVLGSGFSKPLGGPLLPDLLSPFMRQEIAFRFGEAAEAFRQDKNCKAAYRIYERTARGEIWNDAEAYLDFLDRAAREPEGPRAKRLDSPMQAYAENAKLVGVAAGARRIVAAECAAFLFGEDLGLEHWAPYREWARRLGANDTILTFNYDLVLETLKDWWIANAPPGSVSASELRIVSSKAELDTPGGARVFKLHGSVDWELSADEKTFTKVKADQVLTCSGERIAIGMPGPGKRLATEGAFSWLWDEAEKALRAADQVWFIGYRFPESDALAVSRLLGAIRKSRAGAFTVLGPANAATPRLHDLLRWALPDSLPIGYQLWAQDFLGLWRPDLEPPI